MGIIYNSAVSVNCFIMLGYAILLIKTIGISPHLKYTCFTMLGYVLSQLLIYCKPLSFKWAQLCKSTLLLASSSQILVLALLILKQFKFHIIRDVFNNVTYYFRY